MNWFGILFMALWTLAVVSTMELIGRLHGPDRRLVAFTALLWLILMFCISRSA